MHSGYKKANIYDVARYGLLRKTVSEYQALDQLAFYREVSSNSQLNQIVEEFREGTEQFWNVFRVAQIVSEHSRQIPLTNNTGNLSSVGESSLFNHTDIRMEMLEDKVDRLADKLENLTQIIKKRTKKGTPASIQNRESWFAQRTCSYCHRTVHGAAECNQSPERKTLYRRCNQYGHTEVMCCSRRNTTEIVQS